MILLRFCVFVCVIATSTSVFADKNVKHKKHNHGGPLKELVVLIESTLEEVYENFYTQDEVYSKAEVDALIANATADTDGDGVLNINDVFPLDATEWMDTDGDGIGNNADPDDDEDGTPDVDDAFPEDDSENVDTDGDGIGNNADPDDDNDGILDEDDDFPLSALNGHRMLIASSTGSDHVCAITTTGTQCWGGDNANIYNNYGQLTVPSLLNPSQISTKGYHNCALDETGVVCWGLDSNGENRVPSLIDPMFVDAAHGHTCAIDRTGTGKEVVCWGANYANQTVVPSLTNPRWVSGGQGFGCAIDDNGIICWGGNAHGQTDVPALQNPSELSVGIFHACAIDDTGSGGEVVCWGSSTCQNPGEANYCADNLGVIPFTDVPFDVVNPTQVSAGIWHTCAIHDGGVSCWGKNGYINVPNGLNDPLYVSAGETGTCVIDRETNGDEVLKCETYVQPPAGIKFAFTE
ncbi:MAG: hypothetical protein KUG79_20140 [Pseudomonadales bacterium]|nr:hypothetical protein [Pseudomonadales bacterium]